MADYSLQDFWWNKPSRTESQLPALQLGVQIVQQKAKMDLAERDLANDIARTELMRGQEMAKQRIQTSMMEGQAAQAEAIASVNDWTDKTQTRRIALVGMRYPITVGNKAWLGAELMERNAIAAKAKAATDKGESEAVVTGIDEAGNPITENFVRFGNKVFRSTQHQIVQDPKSKKRFIKSGTGALQALDDEANAAVSVNPDTGEEYIEAIPMLDPSGKQVGLGYRGAKGNIIRLPQETGPKLTQSEKTSYDNELKTLNDEEKAKLETLSATSDEASLIRKTFNLKRRALHDKTFPKAARQGLKTEDRTTNAPPAVVAPEANPRAAEIKASFRAGKITREQAEQQLRELGFE